MLAREGYVVLEIGYNLPQYGQENLFTRRTPQPLEYFETAIKRLLQHPKSYGDKVAVIGQSKGVDLAIGIATKMPNLVEVAITNSGHLLNPILIPQSFRNHTIPNIMSNFIEEMLEYVELGILVMDDEGYMRNQHGQFQFYHHNFDPLFQQLNDGNWAFSYSVAAEMKRMGYNLNAANKIVHCQTLQDPTHSDWFKLITDHNYSCCASLVNFYVFVLFLTK